MAPVLLAAIVMLALGAIVLTVAVSKLMRQNRARSAERIAALQALVAEPASAPATAMFQAPALPDDAWDLAFRETSDAAPRIAPEIATPAAVNAQHPAAVSARHSESVSLRSSNFELRSLPEAPLHPLFEESTPRTPSFRWTGMAAAGLVIALGVGVFYFISSGVIGRMVAANSARTNASSTSPIELLSLRYSTDASGDFLVTGLVQNPVAGAPIRGVFAVVYLFDAEGKYFASSRAALESTVLSPGGEAGFTVRVPVSLSSSPSSSSSPSLPSAPEVSRYRVSFQQEDGAAVNHVDRRGTLPDRTTGDTVNRSPGSSDPGSKDPLQPRLAHKIG